ncbi:MAG: hypothetical protein ACRD3G_03265 [Vicinamibacterales bacterium]
MKTIIIHDKDGNILSFLIPVREFADQIRAEPGPEQGVAYVDTTDFGKDAPPLDETSDDRTFAAFGKRIFEDFCIRKGAVTRKAPSGGRRAR